MERNHAVVNGLTRSLCRPGGDVDRQDFKLLIDPAIKKGHAKIFRYNGVFPGQPPVIPRDPRSRRTRIWTLNKADLPVPNFKVDDCYVGIPPQREVLFSSLNDNVDKKFLQQMCERYGKIDAIKIYFDPQTKRHSGKGRVTFSTTTAAKMAAAKLNHTSVMGNIIKAQLEPNIKVLEAHGSQRGSDHPLTRRSAGHETTISAATVIPPAVVCRSLSHLSTPSPSVMSQSPSTDGPVSSPSLLLIRGSATSGRMPGDIWSTTFNNSWDRTAASAIKASQAGSAFLSPQSLSSGHSGFEPVSPPHSFQQNEVPPPPPPPSSNPPPPPLERGSLSDPPPPPPEEKPLSCSSYMKFEDISPVPVFSPEDEGKTSKEKVNDNTLNKSNRRDCTYNSSPSNKVHSPHSDRSECLKTWEKRKQYERDDRARDKYRDCHKYNRQEERDRKYDKHGDHRHKRENYFDRKDDKRDHHRRNDYERNWTSGHWDRDDYKHRKDKYNTSPRRGEDHRKSDTKELRGRDPRLRERDSENSEGRDSQSKDARDRDERDGRDNRCRDPRLRGRNMESDTSMREKKAKDWETDSEPSETRDLINKDSRCQESKIKNMSARDFGVKELEGKLKETDHFKSKVRDPRLQENLNGSDSIYHDEHERHLNLKDRVSRQKQNCETETRVDERTSKEEQPCSAEQSQSDSALKKSASKVVTAAEIVSTLMASAPSAETKPLNRYSDDAYTIGVETCSDEEPLPPGYERDVAHEVQLEITRNKIKAAQNAVKKRKISETTQDDKLDVGAKAKRIQIVLKSIQLNSSETEQSSSVGSDTLSKEEEYVDEGRGGWRCVSLVASDKSTPEVAADVAISSSEAEDSTVTLVNLPLTEDISPCNSPALEPAVQIESNDVSDSTVSKPSKEPFTNDLYSDIEANDDDNDVSNVDNIDDDAMSLSSISSNEDTLEVNKPDQELMSKPKPISVPPPGVVFPPYPPPIFNPSIPPPLIFNPLVPPPPLGPVTVPPPPLPSVPTVPPPVPPPTIRPPSLPPTSLPPRSIPPPQVPPPSMHPLPVPPVPIPPPGFFDKRAAPPPFPSGGYPNSGGFAYQKVEQKKPWRSRIIDEVYRLVYNELDMVITRDIFKKLVEASAFKALESWWDNQTKPKGSAATTASSSRTLPMYEHPPATMGLPSNSGGVASTIGPSPFERPASLVLGLRASLPKLPSFKVKRPPEPPKSQGVESSVRKRINTESPVMHGQEVKKRCMDGREAVDLEVDTDLDSSWDKRPRTISRVEDEERSQSPWQQLDDSMDIAPPATRVRSTEADERRPSTGSSLYHTVYSSGSGSSSSSSESESEESGSDEEDEEEYEEREDEEESEEDTDEDESESDEESEAGSEKEEHQHAEPKMEESTDVDREIEENQGVAQTEIKPHSPVSPIEASVRLPSPAWNNSADSTSAQTKLEPTVEATIVPQPTSPKVDTKDQTEQFRSFHIANIVPDLFKSQEDASHHSTQSVDRNMALESQTNKTETERDNNDLESDSQLRDISAQRLLLKPKNDSRILDFLGVTDGTVKDEQSQGASEVNTPICSPGFGSQEDEEMNIPDEESAISDDAEIDQSSGMFEDRMPLLSPDKPLAVSLVELDHSYGLAIPEEPRARTPLDEPEVFDAVEHQPSRPSCREYTESPVLDVVGLDSLAAGRPPPELVTPKPQFPVRSFEADDELVFEFLKLGVDSEDANFLKVGFQQLQQVGSESVMDAHWSDHPPTAQPVSTKRRKQKTEHGVRVHVTGCARAEGFYKIDINEKAKYLQAQRRQLQCQANVNKEEQQKSDGNKAKQQSREHRAIQRRLQSAVCNEEFGDLLKFNQLMVRKKQLRFAKSGIHDWGLFALESIAADEMVTEYVGEVIRQPMADIRERRYEEMGIGSSYLFRVDQDTIIDATTKGNFARFINHCCDPNCYAKIVTVENAKKIVIYSKRDIAVNEEITYDYKFPIEDEKIPCLCGVAQCRGTLN